MNFPFYPSRPETETAAAGTDNPITPPLLIWILSLSRFPLSQFLSLSSRAESTLRKNESQFILNLPLNYPVAEVFLSPLMPYPRKIERETDPEGRKREKKREKDSRSGNVECVAGIGAHAAKPLPPPSWPPLNADNRARVPFLSLFRWRRTWTAAPREGRWATADGELLRKGFSCTCPIYWNA